MTPSFAASIRSALTDGRRAPASIREMYAYEIPGAESWRCERPRSTRSRFKRSPTDSAPLPRTSATAQIMTSAPESVNTERGG